MFGSRKCPYSPQRRDWKFLGVEGGGGGSQRPEIVKNCMELNWKFRGGLGGGEIRSLGDVWIISGTTQCLQSKLQQPHP